MNVLEIATGLMIVLERTLICDLLKRQNCVVVRQSFEMKANIFEYLIAWNSKMMSASNIYVSSYS